jgi:hypothetical protein
MDSLDDWFEYALDLPEIERERLLAELQKTDAHMASQLAAMLAELVTNPDFACHGVPLAVTTAEPAAVLAIRLPVADLVAAVRWYQDVFRVRVVRQDALSAVVQFRNLEVQLEAAAPPPTLTVAMPDALRLGNATRQPDGSRQLQLVDPFGNVFLVTDRDGARSAE